MPSRPLLTLRECSCKNVVGFPHLPLSQSQLTYNMVTLKICYLLHFFETRSQYIAPRSVTLEFRMLRGPSLVNWMRWGHGATTMGANLAIWAFDVEMWEGVWREV